ATTARRKRAASGSTTGRSSRECRCRRRADPMTERWEEIQSEIANRVVRQMEGAGEYADVEEVTGRSFDAACKRIAELEAEVANLRADAARWRWMAKHASKTFDDWGDYQYEFPNADGCRTTPYSKKRGEDFTTKGVGEAVDRAI